MLERADSLMATEPPKVVPSLEALLKDFKGTSMAAEVETKLATLRKSDELKRSLAVWKGYAKSVKRLARMKNPSDKAIRQTADKLRKLLEGNEDLPVAATVRKTLETLR
jgi:hypothetical protein